MLERADPPSGRPRTHEPSRIDRVDPLRSGLTARQSRMPAAARVHPKAAAPRLAPAKHRSEMTEATPPRIARPIADRPVGACPVRGDEAAHGQAPEHDAEDRKAGREERDLGRLPDGQRVEQERQRADDGDRHHHERGSDPERPDMESAVRPRTAAAVPVARGDLGRIVHLSGHRAGSASGPASPPRVRW